jgi:hypothetical protein
MGLLNIVLTAVLIMVIGHGMAAAVAEWALTPALVQHDDTDPPDSHSGLTLYTDNLTGCQYLSVHGALTPRRDRQGQPVCINR